MFSIQLNDWLRNRRCWAPGGEQGEDGDAARLGLEFIEKAMLGQRRAQVARAMEHLLAAASEDKKKGGARVAADDRDGSGPAAETR